MSTASGTPPTAAEVWATGDYPDVCERMIPELGARLVALTGVAGGERVLDVAAGSGNAALPAARAGAEVTALDITASLLEAGRQRAEAAALKIAWVQGDAEALPFEDASFDRVLSCVGVQFCADRAAAGAELMRVCRPGGTVALLAWTPEGFIGNVLSVVAAASTGSDARPPLLDWGTEAGVADLLGCPPAALSCSREQVAMPAQSAAAWVDYMATAYGPLVRARAALSRSGAWEGARERLIGIAEAHRVPSDSAPFAATSEYLVALVRR